MEFLLANESSGGLASLGLNWGALIFQLINFGILYAVLAKWVFPAVTRLLAQRRETIEAGLADAAAAKAAREGAEAEREKALAAAREQARELVEAARSEAQAEAQRIVSDAQASANAAAQQAERRIATARAEAHEALTQELASVVAAATARVTQDELTPKADAAVIKKAIKEAAAS